MKIEKKSYFFIHQGKKKAYTPMGKRGTHIFNFNTPIDLYTNRPIHQTYKFYTPIDPSTNRSIHQELIHQRSIHQLVYNLK